MSRYLDREYEKYWDSVSSEKTLMNARHREGHAEGHAEGRAEGREESLLQVAKGMIADGETDAKIIKYTGLSPTLITHLRNKMK